MILPASYANGFAPRDAAPLYPELWKGCVGAWNMGLGPTGLTLRDWSGFGNHGTLTNGPTWQASQGKYALDFDNTNDYVETTMPAITGNPVFSLSVWLSIKSTSTVGAVLGFGDLFTSLGGAFVFTSVIASGGLSLEFGGGNGYRTTDIIAVNKWYHVCFTKNSGAIDATTKGFLNAIPLSQTTSSTSTPNVFPGSTIIGAYRNVTPVPPVNAAIDDCRIYNRALSPNEIRLLASRRGIAYEMQDFNRVKQLVTTSSRYNIFSGSVGSNEIIGVA